MVVYTVWWYRLISGLQFVHLSAVVLIYLGTCRQVIPLH